jgi:glutathione-independent formaldehyde dehydrogenase
MRGLVYEGPRDVRVENVPDARIERPTDVLVRITSTNICGSDLHMYEGRTDLNPGMVLGHENLGEVVAVGDGVARTRTGTAYACRSRSAAGSAAIARTG